MSTFEYISVFVAIILGLGIAQIVTGVAHFIHGGNKVKLYWPHTLLIIIIFFFLIQEWWVFYEYKDFDKWRMPVFIFVMLYPIGLFIQTRILFPFDNFDEETDLKKFYFDNYRVFFGIQTIQVILSLIDNMALRGMELKDQILQIVIFIITLWIVVFKVRNELVHKIMIILMSVGIVIMVATSWDEWIIK